LGVQDFGIEIIHTFYIGGQEVWITTTLVNVWIIMAALISIAIIARVIINKRLQSPMKAPTGLQNVVELAIDTFDRFVRNSAGEKFAFLGNWFFAVFALILLSNWSGLVGLRNPTADWALTGMLGIATFFLIHIMGIRYKGLRYIKELFEPFIPIGPIKVPNIPFGALNIIGECARPISLSFRLFGNLLAGLILIEVFYGLAGLPWALGVPIILHGFFDVVIGGLQSFVFTVLSLSFIGVAANEK